MNAIESGQKFLTELLAHVPADKQAAVKEAFESSQKAVETLGAGVLRQSDYSRQADATRAEQEAAAEYKRQLDEWYAQNQAALAEAERLRLGQPAPGTPATPFQTPAAAVPVGVTREELDKELRTREQAAISAIVHTNQLSSKHYATFKEPLDITALMADPDIGKLGLTGVYDKHYKPKYDDLAKKADDARIQAEVDRRVAELRKASPLPYPVHGREPSPLDALEQALAKPADPTKPVTPPANPHQVVDDAVAQYEAAQARAYGSPTP